MEENFQEPQHKYKKNHKNDHNEKNASQDHHKKHDKNHIKDHHQNNNQNDHYNKNTKANSNHQSDQQKKNSSGRSSDSQKKQVSFLERVQLRMFEGGKITPLYERILLSEYIQQDELDQFRIYQQEKKEVDDNQFFEFRINLQKKTLLNWSKKLKNNPELLKDYQDIIQYWHEFPIKFFKQIVLLFKLKNNKDKLNLEDVQETIYKLIQKGQYDMGAQVINSFELGNNLKEYFIKVMIDFKNSSKCKKYLNQWDAEIEKKFPQIQESFLQGDIRYNLGQMRKDPQKQFTPYFLEMRFQQDRLALQILVNQLIQNKQIDVAVEIAARNKIHLKQNFPLPQKETTNPLVEFDAFGPTEENIGLADVGTYLSLKDLGVFEDNVHHISNTNTKKFQFSYQILMDSQIVGFDTEGEKLNLIQISGKDYAFLYDFTSLQHDAQFGEFIAELFSSDKIIKVGQGLVVDTSLLRKKIPQIKQFNNLIDTQNIFKALYPKELKSSLAFISEKLYKKPLSKFEQMSQFNQVVLRKAQKHYAAMDAVICQRIVEDLINNPDRKDLIESLIVKNINDIDAKKKEKRDFKKQKAKDLKQKAKEEKKKLQEEQNKEGVIQENVQNIEVELEEENDEDDDLELEEDSSDQNSENDLEIQKNDLEDKIQ